MFDTKHQKKAFVYTSFIVTGLVILLFLTGMQYQDPPIEYGILVNFGTSDVGQGEPDQLNDVRSSEYRTIEEQSQQKTVNTSDALLTSSQNESIVVDTKKNKNQVSQTTTDKKNIKAEEAQKPVPAKETQNLLNSLFGKSSNGVNTKGQGNDGLSGLKGSVDGDPNSSKYYGVGGSGSDGNYLLKGRKVLAKPINKPECNEEGIVVVKIEVDNNGNVISADPGVKGTTNFASCLLEPAKRAALKTKWNPDGNAPNKQVGLIKYNFVLSQ